jgi:hypothetical protein
MRLGLGLDWGGEAGVGGAAGGGPDGVTGTLPAERSVRPSEIRQGVQCPKRAGNVVGPPLSAAGAASWLKAFVREL